jgi:hypothetical protein
VASRLTERDLDLLAFIAEHRVVVVHHAQRFLGTSLTASYARLRALSSSGLVSQSRVMHGHPGCYLATAAGIRTVGKGYRAQKIDHACLQHDLGVASLWLAARAGAFGPVKEVISERAMRSEDKSPDRADAPLGVRLGGVGERGHERVHYPDLLLVDPSEKRIAFELELTSKGATRRQKIMMAYAFDRRIDAVIYLVRDRALGRKIQASARRVGISDLVQVQLLRGLPYPGAASRGPARAASRRREDHVR